MRRLSLLLALGCALLGGCQQSDDEPVVDANVPGRVSVGELAVGEPVVHANLTIFPVFSQKPKNDDRFITLDEGLRSGKVEIMETGAVEQPAAPAADERQSANGEQPDFEAIRDLITSTVQGDVNRLMVVNRSGKPLYLMSGEMIVGGKQDRTIGTELVIQPTEKPVPIDAFCVEHGRWANRGGMAASVLNALVSSQSQTHAQAGEHNQADQQSIALAAQEAEKGKFVASPGTVSSKVRHAVQGDKSQSAVWSNVAKANAGRKIYLSTAGLAPGNGEDDNVNGVLDSSDAFTANYTDTQTAKVLGEYVQALHKPVADADQIVGVLVAVDGKLVTMDVFESTPLFRKLWPKLLKSYALDAITTATLEKEASADSKQDEKSKQPSEKSVAKLANARDFLNEALTAKSTESTSKDGLTCVKREGKWCVSFAAHDATKVPHVTSVIPVVDGAVNLEAAGGFGNVGGGVHTSAFGK